MLKQIKYFALIVVLSLLIENLNGLDETYEQYMARIEYHDTPLAWDDARKTCENEGTYLVAPYNWVESTYLTKKASNKHTWLGLNKTNGQMATFLNGKRYNDQYYSLWAGAEPSGGLNWEKCIEAYPGGNWNDKPCTYKLPFFCYRKPKIFMSGSALSYADAIKYCQKVWTAKSWWDIKYASLLAKEKSFWTGSERKSGSDGYYTPYGIKAFLWYGIKDRVGCSYSNSPDYFDAADCTLKKFIFCEIVPPTPMPTIKPTNKPTLKPTNKPTPNPTPDPYQQPVFLYPIDTQTVKVNEVKFFKIPVDTLFEPGFNYGKITWSIEESSQNIPNENLVKILGESEPVLIFTPSVDTLGIHWFKLKATGPTGKSSSNTIIVNVISN